MARGNARRDAKGSPERGPQTRSTAFGVPRPFEVIAEGFVHRAASEGPGAVACGSRCAVTNSGEVVCTFMVQAAMGLNDFVPLRTRSRDGGITWDEAAPIWPRLREQYSIFGSVSGSPRGGLFFFGSRTGIDAPGEPNWSPETQGLKANELLWARSGDDGRSWTDPRVIPMPIPGAAEAPGAMCVTRDGAWHVCYSPYNTFDPKLVVPRNQVVLMTSRDEGRSWAHTAMLRFELPYATAAEAWVIELADGRLLGTCWNLNQQDGSDFPNAYGLSLDGGRSWRPTRSTSILGQSTALAALPDGRALFIYNQRQHGEPGVRLAVVSPTEGVPKAGVPALGALSSFGVQADELAWSAKRPTVSGSATGHADWTGFGFGEPHVAVLPDGSWLVVLWCIQPDGRGIRYVKLRPRV